MLDVVSLFTNFPVNYTICIILDAFYNISEMIAPVIPRNEIEELLKVCTMETPFKDPNGNVLKQVDGRLMGSHLGPLFADFYMATVKNKVLPNLTAINKLKLYCRYVDDIFLYVENIRVLHNVKSKLQEAPKIKFTFEIEVKRQMPFLDSSIT